MARSNVLKTTFQYLAPLPVYKYTKPYHVNIPSTALGPGQQSNEVSRPYHDILVQDIRGGERDFTLDRNGFVVLSDQSSNNLKDERERPSTCLLHEQYQNQDKIRNVYRNAVENWLKAELGAEEVAAFTHEVRRRASSFPEHPRGEKGLPQPVQGVHGDFTGSWALERMKMHFGDEKVLGITKRRWQVLNVWRPLFGPLEDWPLAVCDFESLKPDDDLIASDNVYPHMVSETYNVLHRPSHRWYYLSKMLPHEILVFKSFDSDPDSNNGQAFMCPHAAFQAYDAPKTARPRESIECIAFVIYPA